MQLHCPHDHSPPTALEAQGERLLCPQCRRSYAQRGAFWDFRHEQQPDAHPSGDCHPLLPSELEALEEATDQLSRSRRKQGSADYKGTLEKLLLRLSPATAEALMLLLREGRASWLGQLERADGKALFLGNPLSGTPIALARSGFEVTLLDHSEERLKFACFSERGHLTEDLQGVLCDGPRLPFPERYFDLVVIERGWPLNTRLPMPSLLERAAEWLRVANDQCVLIADNRLAYKRSRGLRGKYKITSPWRFLASTLGAGRPQRTRSGYRKWLLKSDPSGSHQVARELALYPHSGEFSQIASLDGERPRLFLGPLERRNRLKMFGQRLGLFGALTPTFTFVTKRTHTELGDNRIERVLQALTNPTSESGATKTTNSTAKPKLEHCIASRGNSIVALTQNLNDESAPTQEGLPYAASDKAAKATRDWVVHIPLGEYQRRMLQRHADVLVQLEQKWPNFPAPRLRFCGELEGLFLTAEDRAPGLSAAQRAGDEAAAEVFLLEAGQHLAELVIEHETIDHAAYERLFQSKFEWVLRHLPDAENRRAVEQIEARVRTEVLGMRIPLVLQHADLRSKHLQIASDGSVTGFLDWGSALDVDLPYFDLLHLVAQTRKEAQKAEPLAAWRLALGQTELNRYEKRALAHYAERLGLDPAFLKAMGWLYPVLVGSQAERVWDYSRPHWLRRHFQLCEVVKSDHFERKEKAPGS